MIGRLTLDDSRRPAADFQRQQQIIDPLDRQFRRVGKTVPVATPPSVFPSRCRKDRHHCTLRLGVQVASELVAQLLDIGVPGVHLYAMNRAQSIEEIYENLGLRT